MKALSIFANLGATVLENAMLYTELAQTEAKYHSIFEHALTGIFQTTPEGRFISANPALVRMLAYPSVEALMASINDIEGQLYVDPSRRHELIYQLAEHGSVSGFHARLYRRDGSVIWVSLNARAAYDEHGDVLYYEGTVEDITTREQAAQQLRESEARFRSVAEAAMDAIIVCDSEEQIISWNSAAQAMFGYTAQEVLGTAVTMVLPERYRGAFVDWLCGASMAQMSSESQPPTGTTIESYGLRLVVDDEPTLTEVLQEMLAMDGHQVEVASNGAIALEKLREQAYDLTIRDLRMPVLSGPGLYDALGQQYPELCRRLIFFTGDTLNLELKAFLERVAVPTVSKPFAWEEVRRVVRRVLQSGGREK